jgi:8-oxo-dGTP pyrophosphatase MutT (NUDIX family)
VSFPGGRLDEGEDALAAALREAAEEVGIKPAAVEIIGELSPLATVGSRSAITPFVGVLKARPVLTPNPDEVELAFDVSLAELMRDGVFREERWRWMGQEDRPMYFFDLPDDTIWGATARMLYELLELVALT